MVYAKRLSANQFEIRLKINWLNLVKIWLNSAPKSVTHDNK